MLKQYNSLTEEIKELEKEIKCLEGKELKVITDKVTGSNDKFPYEKKHFHIEGVVEDERLVQKRNVLLKRKLKCEYMKVEIEEFINTIPDSLTRRVFKYRYIYELSWLQVAFKIDRYDESYPRKMIHDRYLEEIK